jgi:uncharacterized membrane protein
VSTVSVWNFDVAGGAASGLRLLERLQNRGRLAINDSAVAEWPPENRRPMTYQVGAVSGDAMLSGAFWGLLFGVLFLAPLAGLTGPIWPPAGLRRIGLPEAMLQQVRDRTTPGTSALFVVSADAELDQIRDALTSTEASPACVASTLTSEEESALRHAFGTDCYRVSRDAVLPPCTSGEEAVPLLGGEVAKDVVHGVEKIPDAPQEPVDG